MPLDERESGPILGGDDRPIVAVSGRRYPATSLNPGDTRGLVAGLYMDGFYAAYAEKIFAAGGTPIYVTREAPAAALLPRIDALVLAGGIDVDPRLYGGRLTSRSTDLDPDQDAYEIDLAIAAVDRNLPVLGICRGHELLNVAFGGSLRADLGDDLGPYHARTAYPRTDRGHPIRIDDGAVLHGLYGDSAEVNSFHHQAIDSPGDGLTAVASAEDGVIEAVELESGRAIGVQWHPELAPDPEPILAWLVGLARG